MTVRHRMRMLALCVSALSSAHSQAIPTPVMLEPAYIPQTGKKVAKWKLDQNRHGPQKGRR